MTNRTRFQSWLSLAMAFTFFAFVAFLALT